MKLAAIDIGSNAARLLITEVMNLPDGRVQFQKLNLIRIPLRLGMDVFENKSISIEKKQMMVDSLLAYQSLLNAYGIQKDHVIIAATSAMREAQNNTEVIQEIFDKTGLRIEVISGELEANIIYENHIAEKLDHKKSYLYIDVGGGSTELTFFSKGSLIFKKSFDIGTLRILKGKVDNEQWDDIKSFIKKETKDFDNIVAIGSGGNINKIFSLSKKKEGKPLSLDLLKDYFKELNSFSIEERIQVYQMREDRADVIVPALQIYIQVMRWASISEIYVPKIGLADGLVQHLYDQLQQTPE